MKDIDLETTILELKSGETAALDVLIEFYTQKLYGFCCSILKNDADAEEAVQDTFIKVYKKIDTFDLSTNFTAWIYRIASNTAKDILRRHKKHSKCISFDKPISDDNASDSVGHCMEISDNSENPSSNLQIKETKSIIFDEIEALPDLYKEVLLLRHIEDFSYDEIAEILNCNVGTVKSRLFRAREILKEKIELKSK